MNYILIAEDDETLRNGLETAFTGDGFGVCTCRDGAEAMEAYEKRRPDLMILDIMMPRMTGYQVCSEIRRKDPSLPIIFLTAKSAETDVVIGLGLGADDFVRKPFRIRELRARAAAALRRSMFTSPNSISETFFIGKAKIDSRRYLVYCEDESPQPLTIREIGLLKMFAEHSGEVLTRSDLLDNVWGMDYTGTSRTLDQHIVQVRRKLGPDGNLIETIRGAGYRLRTK